MQAILSSELQYETSSTRSLRPFSTSKPPAAEPQETSIVGSPGNVKRRSFGNFVVNFHAVLLRPMLWMMSQSLR